MSIPGNSRQPLYDTALWFSYGFWSQYPERSRCPRVLAGYQCRSDSPTLECICRYQFGTPDFLDHSRRWLNEVGYPLITAEPYIPAIDNHPKEWEKFLEELSELNLSIQYGILSPWSPSHGGTEPTQLLIFSAQGTISGKHISPTRPEEYNPKRIYRGDPVTFQ